MCTRHNADIDYLNRRLHELLSSHFSCTTDEDRNFLDYLEHVICIHARDSARHRNLYFNSNSKISKTNSIIETIKNFTLSTKNILIFSNVWSIFFTFISSLLIYKYGKSFISILATLILLILLILNYIISNQNFKSRELKLRRHCETWVRHECAYQRLTIEIMTYVNSVGKYSDINNDDAKKLFKSTILDLYGEDIDNFENNMRGTEESIQ